MKSRDGFEVVRELLREDVNRREVLRLLGWSGVALAGALRWACPRSPTPRSRSAAGRIKIGSFRTSTRWTPTTRRRSWPARSTTTSTTAC